MTQFIYIKVQNGIAYDSSHSDKYQATQRLIQLRKMGKIAKMFTEDELMQMQYESQSQQPVQQPQPTQRHQPRPRHKMGIVSMPRQQGYGQRQGINPNPGMFKPHIVKSRRR